MPASVNSSRVHADEVLRRARYRAISTAGLGAALAGTSLASGAIVTGNNAGNGWVIDSMVGAAGGNQTASSFASNGSNGGANPFNKMRFKALKYDRSPPLRDARTMYFSAVNGGSKALFPVVSGAAINGTAVGNWGGGGAALIGSATYAGSWRKAAVGVVSATTFFTTTTFYLAFRFTESSITKYGWARIELTTSGGFRRNLLFKLQEWAYDDTGASINAGQLTPSAVPGGAGLAALAFGAAGLRGRRRSGN